MQRLDKPIHYNDGMLLMNESILDGQGKLVERIRSGDGKAEEELVRYFSPRVFAMLMARTRDREASRDLLQDVLIAVLRSVREGALRDAERLSFAQIEKAIEGFVAKSRDDRLTLDDLRGGTFTITNGGVFGSLLSTPILNPPQVGILGLHKIEERPVARQGQVVIRPMMYVALSYDHRLVDGREAVQFLVRVKELIEDPETMLIEG